MNSQESKADTDNMPEKEAAISFEDAMHELEEIVSALEDGNAPLGESLQLVQRGRELSEICAQMLNEAELTLSRLAATPEGELVEEELDWDAENS